MLEFLSARFVHPDAPQITILSFFNINTNQNIRITKANKLFFLATMISELQKYLNKQLGVFFKCETAKMLANNIKNEFLIKNVFV